MVKLLSQAVPDRFDANLDKYRGRALSETGRAAFLRRTRKNASDPLRYYMLALICDRIELEGLTGDVAELGVYRGSTARIIAELATRIGGIAYLFDTFAGLPEGDRLPVDGCSGSFDDTDAVNVSRLMRGTNFRLCQGRFPDTVGMVDAEAKFVLVHIDCDLYVPAKAALEFFYPRLVTGGFLIVHDYSSNFWPGVEKAVDEYFSSSRCIVPMPDKAGSIVVRK